MLDLKDLAYARSRPGYPTEAQEQTWLIQWVRRHGPAEAKRLFHIPNGGGRSKSEGAMMKLQGVQAGVPDLFLPVPRYPHHGLWIELKSLDPKSAPSAPQKEWLEYLATQGYRVAVCSGFEAARDELVGYLNPTKTYSPEVI